MGSSQVPRLLSVEEVSEATGLGAWRVYQLCAERKLPFIRVGRTLRFSEAALAKWIEQQSAASTQSEEA